MSIISLLTDFSLKDNFVGVMKGVILKINPEAKIVDICHQVKPQGLLEAALLLKSSFRYFPSGTAHLVVVDPQVGSKRKKILVKTKNYFFIAPDNGVLSPALKEEPAIEIIEITNEKYFLKPLSNTFHGRDIFAPVAAHVSKGEHVEEFGRRIESFQVLELPKVKITSQSLVGEVIYIDHFGNLVSNIDAKTFKNFTKNKIFKVFIKDKIINHLSHSYAEGLTSKPLALIDSFNYLEIALRDGSVSDYLAVDKGEKVVINRI